MIKKLYMLTKKIKWIFRYWIVDWSFRGCWLGNLFSRLFSAMCTATALKRYIYDLQIKFKDGCYQFLAHLSWKLKWAILIARCPSVCLSVNFYIFDFFSRTTGPILTRLGTNHPWGEGIQVCSNEGDHPSLRGKD
jgi:hypothetical protein